MIQKQSTTHRDLQDSLVGKGFAGSSLVTWDLSSIPGTYRKTERTNVTVLTSDLHKCTRGMHSHKFKTHTHTHTYPKHWNSPKLVLISLWNNLSKENLGPCRHGSHLPRSCLSPIGNKGVLCSMPICAESPLAYSVDVLWDIYRNDSRASCGGS